MSSGILAPHPQYRCGHLKYWPSQTSAARNAPALVFVCLHGVFQLLERADRLFKYYVANTYLTNIPMLCLLLYSLIVSTEASAAYHLIIVFHCFYATFQMAAVSVIAIMISSQV